MSRPPDRPARQPHRSQASGRPHETLEADDGGGLIARWRARIRLQRQREESGERRAHPRIEPDRSGRHPP